MNNDKTTVLERIKLLQTDHFKDYTNLHTSNSDDWHQVCLTSKNATQDYLHLYTDYHLAYLRSSGYAADLSVVFYANSVAVAIWPLTLYKERESLCMTSNYKLQSHCQAIIPPLIVDHTSIKQTKKILQQCLSFLRATHTINELSPICCQIQPSQDITWHRLLSPHIEKIHYHQQLYLTLTRPINELVKDFRKSYRSLINQGLKLWNVELLHTLSDHELEEIRQFHIKIAGKETRSLETWRLQQNIINAQKCFVIRLTDKTNDQLVGAAFFNVINRYASYSLGVYERSLFASPIGHVVQIEAIKHMIELEVTKYYLGERHQPYEYPKPTEKQSSIGFFKEGFSNAVEISAKVTIS